MPEHDLVVLGDCIRTCCSPATWCRPSGQVEQIVDEAKLTIGGSGAIAADGTASLGMRTDRA
jgi:hypothetical protein